MFRGLAIAVSLGVLVILLVMSQRGGPPRKPNRPVPKLVAAVPPADQPPVDQPVEDQSVGDQPATAAPNAKAVPAHPPRVIVEQTIFEAGEVPGGKTVSFSFLLKNRGEGPLEIATATDCYCTVVRHADSIPPGDQGKIEGELNTQRLHGPIKKSIRVQTNDPARPLFLLRIAGNVTPAVEILPNPNPTFNLKFDAPTVYELRLRPRTVDHVEVTGVKCSQPYAQAVLEPTTDETGRREYRLTLTVQPEAPLGGSGVIITLSTTAELQPEMLISAYCEKGILISPATLQLKASRPGAAAPATGAVVVRTREGTFQIQKAASSDPNLEVQIEPLKAGTFYRLKVTARGPLPAVRSPATIAIETDDPHQPHLEIPVTYLAPPAAP